MSSNRFNIIIVDNDIVDITNLNRQILSLRSNIGRLKVDVAHERIMDINPDCKVTKLNIFLDKSNISELFKYNIDYIIDACDTTIVKVKLIEECHKRGIKLVSCMGTANKIDATKIELTTLDKTDYDPLAKKIRKELKNKDIMKNVVVISSNEKAINPGVLGSTSYVPAVAGLYVTNYIINDVIKDKVI